MKMQERRWTTKKIGDLFEIQQGKALSAAARAGRDQAPFLRTSNVLWNSIDVSKLDFMSFTESERARLTLRSGDLLVCEGGEIGRAAVWTDQVSGCFYQNHIHRLRAISDKIDPWFASYWLRAAFLLLGSYDGIGNRTTIPNLAAARLKEFEIPAPPIEEQRAVSTLLSKLRRAVDAQHRLVTVLRELQRTVRANLFFANVDSESEPWPSRQIGDVFEIQLGKMLSPKARTGVSPSRYLRNIDVQWERVNTKNLPEMDFDIRERKKYELRKGDVLVCEGGEPGRAAVWNGELTPCFYQKAVLRLRPKGDDILPEFFVDWAAVAFAQNGQHDFRTAKTTIAHLPAVKLAALTMPQPSLADQRTITKITASLKRLVIAEDSKLLVLSELFAAVLREVFSGERLSILTPSKGEM